ncbi:PREDICTED: plant intracellular Ras-group-related LRR protein 4-like [Prunus mume]|uniref:Plant intracellular Ras-group-related LRR protein 4-like n=1 Tax=Prunus mume TaxID=102107 RepID=A0ABM0PNE5_PRUMU|nr:PREDICTED: plant intracellular Ras-group-related LRR protein 4-like [Prunus mume]
METTAFQSVDQVVEEIMRIHRSLPARPGVDEVEAAVALVQNVEKEDQARLDAIARQTKTLQVPEELFMVLQEMQRSLVYFHSKEQKREALKLLDLENLHNLFDDFIQRASTCVASPNSTSSSSAKKTTTMISNSNSNSVSAVPHKPSPSSASAAHVFHSDNNEIVAKSSSVRVSRDDSFMVNKAKKQFLVDGIGARPAVSSTPQIVDSSLKPGSALNSTGGQESEKLSLIKLASLIEVLAKKGTKDLNLRNKLMDQIEWLPDSIGKLSRLVSLDLSENRILVLPSTIGGLSSLTKLDLHSNRIAQLPDAIGDLLSLVSLDLSANDLTTLPATFGRLVRLEELDLSSNRLPALPDSIGSLASLKILNVETNDIEEIPHTIGHCSSLKELRADYNRLKALPEAVGKIESLEVLSVRYNNIKQLPTTVSSLLSLRELDVSFNELESVPENLCFATSLVKMNIGNNFADLRYLPRSIGNLEMLEELDISNNQIRVLPDSFRMLTRLRVLRVEENPLEVPPRHIAEKGAQAVVQYMTELVVKREVKAQPAKQKKTWAQICFFSRSNKRKRSGGDYVKA